MCEGQSSEHHHEHGHILVPETILDRRRFLVAGGIGLGAALVAACSGRSSSPGSASSQTTLLSDMTTTSSTALPMTTAGPAPTTTDKPASQTTTEPLSTEPDAVYGLAGFDEFADSVAVTRDGSWWLVESNGLPAHSMMTGITSWQQQVPVEQPYRGSNAWKIPVAPKVSPSPVSARTALYRGAIALAVNGVPIFNALNNRGDDAFLFGELDRWGGHSGRADDYHYHIAPLHLSDRVGRSKPIAFALDGFPIFGETEPDGSMMRPLDDFNGHFDETGGYHYHGTRTYPYINGGLRGIVTVSGDQIEPQPRTNPFRPAGEPLRGATVTSFSSPVTGQYILGYMMNGATGEVRYSVSETEVSFVFTSPAGVVTRETYSRHP